MKLKTFPMGGIHPPENKISAGLAIEVLPVPEQVSIPLSQHLGAPAVPIVKKGDKIKVGSLIAEGRSFISSNIHSSVSGTVLKIDDVPDVTGYRRPSIIINVEGDEWEDYIDRSMDLDENIQLGPKEIIDRVNTSGIVGKGGAGFPTNVKIMVPEDKSIDTLVINGVECEPYLTADDRIMIERPDEILVGIEILKKALDIKRALIGIEANKLEAIDIMAKHAARFSGTDVVPLKVQYPQGAEKQLIKALVNREVPSGKLPLDVGCVVNNVGTAMSVYKAVQKNKPLFERVVTITGKHLKKPGNYKVRIGTPISALVEAAGGLPENTGKVISGGPMMGKAVISLDVPVTKATSGIVVLGKEESFRAETQNCIRCGKCVGVCPMGLEPYLLEKVSELQDWDRCEAEHIADCVECGSCSYTCPSNRPLLDYIRYGKATVMKLRRHRSKA